MRLGLQIAIIVSLFACVMTVIGYVLLVQWNKPATSTTETAELIRTSTPIILFGIFIFIVMAGTMTFLIRSVTNPVKKLRDAADKITRGNLDVQPNIKGTTEVRDLVISFNTMVNTLKKAKELQSAAVAKYKNLYENAPGLYRTVSVDGIIADCNKSFAEHLGYTVEEVIGTHYNKYTDPKDVEAMTHSFETWKLTGVVKNIEIWLKTKGGTTFPTLISVSNLYDEKGNLIGCNNVIRDISEIHEARKKREKDAIMDLQLAEVKKMEKLKDEFASMMTHELKTPLTPIMGHCEMLKEPGLLGDLNQIQLDSINKISENALRLQRLIGDVMLAQRLEIGQMNFDKQKFEVTKLMSEVHNDYSKIMNEKQIEFVNSTQENLSLWSDKNRVREVIDNLIQNAVDFTPKNNGRIEIGARSEDSKVVFYVQDNGIGIPKAVQPTMFKKFYQVDASHRRKHTGTGLGLVICKGIVEGLGGGIWFESEPGKSTSFYFSIPDEVYWKNRLT
ncbi:MAG: PAS domain S-box protein [Thaumarchaeota archaeon]|nr:MAG: PAS domain S-box protein [Nitrososphaerota archaeon]